MRPEQMGYDDVRFQELLAACGCWMQDCDLHDSYEFCSGHDRWQLIVEEGTWSEGRGTVRWLMLACGCEMKHEVRRVNG